MLKGNHYPYSGIVWVMGKPRKSWNLSISVSRLGKSWNLIIGQGKSWKIVVFVIRNLIAGVKAGTK